MTPIRGTLKKGRFEYKVEKLICTSLGEDMYTVVKDCHYTWSRMVRKLPM